MENISTIYIIQDGKDRGTNIYKIGKTDKPFKGRFSAYSDKSIVYETYDVDSSICNKIEMYIIRYFKSKYKLEKGREWFSGNVEEMKKDISTIIELHGYVNKHLVSCAEKYEKELDSYKDKFLELEQKYNKELDSYKEQFLNKVKENEREIHTKDMEIYSLKLKVILLEKEVAEKEKQKNDIKVILDKSLDAISNISCSK